MIHVVTVHFGSDKWVDVQLSYLQRHLSEPYETWANLEGVEHRAASFDHVVEACAPHAPKLNLMAAEVAAVAGEDDLLMFLDGDAFPIVDPMPVVRSALEDSCLVAVRRAENLGEPQPHPSFTVIRVRDWVALNGDWTPGFPWMAGGKPVSDVGGNLLRLLQLHDKTWHPLLRSNRVDLHPVWYGIYGGIVYHHGAGFRQRFSRHDASGRPAPVLSASAARPVVGPLVQLVNDKALGLWVRRKKRAAQAEGDEIFRSIVADPEFYRRFM